MVLRKILDQYVSSYQRWSQSVIRLGNNEVLKTLTKTLTFVDAHANANANADAGGSTVALCEPCSGELKISHDLTEIIPIYFQKSDGDIINVSVGQSVRLPSFQSVSQFISLFVCPSGYLLLNHKAEFYQTCYITSPHG